MKKDELLSTLNKYNITPSKRLGQNFLIDENIVRFIDKAASPQKDQVIIEVGPGLGILTKYLVNSGANIIAVEYDSRLADFLKTEIKDTNFSLIHADACKLDFNTITKGYNNFRIISNLPYSISTPLVSKLLELENLPEDMIFLLQKETAQRFIAPHNNKTYGSISVRIQVSYETDCLKTISPSVFYPKPDVDSAIVKFTRKQFIPPENIRKSLSRLVKIAFSKRRKKLINNISILSKNLNFIDLFRELNIDLNARPENLSPATYLKLAEHIF